MKKCVNKKKIQIKRLLYQTINLTICEVNLENKTMCNIHGVIDIVLNLQISVQHKSNVRLVLKVTQQ